MTNQTFFVGDDSQITNPVTSSVRAELMKVSGATGLSVDSSTKTITWRVSKTFSASAIPSILTATSDENVFTLTIDQSEWTVELNQETFQVPSLKAPVNTIGCVNPSRKRNGSKFFIKAESNKVVSTVPATIRAQLMTLPGAQSLSVDVPSHTVTLRVKDANNKWPSTPTIFEPTSNADEFKMKIEGLTNEEWVVKIAKQRTFDFESIYKQLDAEEQRFAKHSTAFFLHVTPKNKRQSTLPLVMRNQLMSIHEVTGISVDASTVTLKMKKNFNGWSQIPEFLQNGKAVNSSTFANQFTFDVDSDTYNVNIAPRSEEVLALKTPENRIGQTKRIISCA